MKNRKHTAGNQARVPTEQQAVDLLAKGYSIRVETRTRPSLVRLNLFVDGKRIS